MKLKNKIALLSFATLLALPAFAEPAVTHDSTMTHGDQPIWSGDFGLGTVDSKFHFGVAFKGQIPVTYDGNDFKFGLKSGFYLGPSDSTDFIIPILATAEYDFRVNGNIKPYLGLEMGASITHVSGRDGFDGNTSTDFAFLFKPGIKFSGNRYYFELPLGTMAGDFVFLPSIGMHF